MALLVPDDFKQQLDTFESSFAELEGQVKQLLQLLEAADEEDYIEQAQAHSTLAKAANQLLHWYLRCNAVDPWKHPSQNEKHRVDQYVKKVKKAAAAHELSKLRPKTTLNVAAANRFIDHAIPDLTPEQRQTLKQVTQKYKEQGQEQQGQRQGSGAKRSGGPPRSASKQQKQRQGTVKDAALAFLQDVAAEARKGPAAEAGGAAEGGE